MMNRKTSEASAARRASAIALEERVLQIIEYEPGLSIYQIAKKIDRNPGAVRKAVKRLEEREVIETITTLERGRAKRMVFPKELKPWQALDWENPENIRALKYLPEKLREEIERWLEGRKLGKEEE